MDILVRFETGLESPQAAGILTEEKLFTLMSTIRDLAAKSAPALGAVLNAKYSAELSVGVAEEILPKIGRVRSVEFVPAAAEGEEAPTAETWELLEDEQHDRTVDVLNVVYNTVFTKTSDMKICRETRTIAGWVKTSRGAWCPIGHTVSKATLRRILGEG